MNANIRAIESDPVHIEILMLCARLVAVLELISVCLATAWPDRFGPGIQTGAGNARGGEYLAEERAAAARSVDDKIGHGIAPENVS
jgi:hypothetical protein